MVSKQNTREIIHRLKDIKKLDKKNTEKLGKELCYKKPWPSLIIKKIVKHNGKLI
jgi:hypothetical protein